MLYSELPSSDVDSAFVDRADIVQYVDLPSRNAIYEILRSSLCEIVGKGIVNPIVRGRTISYRIISSFLSCQNVPTLKQAEVYATSAKHSPNALVVGTDPQVEVKNVALRLLALATQCRVRIYILILGAAYKVGILGSKFVRSRTSTSACPRACSLYWNRKPLSH